MRSCGQAAAHQGDHRPADDGFARVGAAFVVPDQAAAAQKPRKGPLHDPAAGKGLEASDVFTAAGDVEDEAEVLAGPGGEVAGVAAVSADPGQPPEAAGRRWQK